MSKKFLSLVLSVSMILNTVFLSSADISGDDTANNAILAVDANESDEANKTDETNDVDSTEDSANPSNTR